MLTASGGPFRGRTREELADVTPAEALAHPTWDMGLVVTTNSATLVNKGLEVIEAHLLFDVQYDRIDVVVHPQSIVHSMVEFIDGSTIAQASPPDMRLPISLGLDWPDRVARRRRPLDWTTRQLDFEPLDDDGVPRGRPREAGGQGGASTRRCSTPRTSRRSSPSTRAGSASSASSTPCAGRRLARGSDRDAHRRVARRRGARGPARGRRAHAALADGSPREAASFSQPTTADTKPAAVRNAVDTVFSSSWASSSSSRPRRCRSACTRSGTCVPAKQFGVKVAQYMIGFGPTIWSRRRGETEYGVKAIPSAATSR